jgi:tetratricopeptide (TPR) repeat protein
MKAGADMTFLFGPLQVKSDENGAVPLKVSLYCYDGMNKEDKVFAFTGTTVISSIADKKSLTDEASDAGKLVAEPFEAQWKHEQYSIAYYDNMKWYEALARAEQYDWKGAMDIWLDCLNTNDMLKRASAEYNIAVACYMLGDLALAEEWLDRSVADNEMPTLTDALSKRIKARK